VPVQPELGTNVGTVLVSAQVTLLAKVAFEHEVRTALKHVEAFKPGDT
jgi:hypothetical protein